jgi:hypothetical protein
MGKERRIVPRLCVLFNGKVLFVAVIGSLPHPHPHQPPSSEVSTALVWNKVDPVTKSVIIQMLERKGTYTSKLSYVYFGLFVFISITRIIGSHIQLYNHFHILNC